MKRKGFPKESTIDARSTTAGKVPGRTSETVAVEFEGDNYSKNSTKLIQRKYDRTGVRLSIIGFGGIVVQDTEQQHANRVVAEAFEKGVNYFDVSPTYGDAELKLGPALKPYRKKVFLACKTGQRRREGASEELNFTLSQPITAAIPPGEESLFRMALDLGLNFKPLSTPDLEKVKQMAGSLNLIFPT